tara:strand:- start:24 stop:1097 length:1074 start_codon:yes stop_codon:yes gene_type:complete
MAYSTISKPGLHFNTILYTGDGTSPKARTGVGFQPDWVWSKARDVVRSHQLIDSPRGVNKTLSSDNANQEGTDYSHGYLQSFDSDGFTSQAGTSGHNNWNQNSAPYVVWNWKANGGTGASNSSGTISSTVYANTTAGFSMVKYVGNGSAGATVGHGLGAIPDMYMVKDRDTNGAQWTVYHQSMGATKAMQLDTTTNAGTNILYWNNTAPTSTVFSLGAGGDPNGNTKNYIAYCFKAIKGYSKFSNYIGNQNADGTFVYTGFKPAWVMIKKQSSGTGRGWFIFDNKREGYNVDNDALEADTNVAEVTNDRIDFLSNGFKLRTTELILNESSIDYIYMAFAENPLVANVGANGTPATAR